MYGFISRIVIPCVAILFFLHLIKIYSSYDKMKINQMDETKNYQNVSEIETEFNFDYKNMMSNMKLETTKLFGIPFVFSDEAQHTVFRGISDWIFDKNASTLEVNKVKCGDIIFVKTDYLLDFFEQYHPNITTNYFLMSHDSAYSVGYPWQLKYLDDPKIFSWFAKNTITRHPKFVTIPLGMTAPESHEMSIINSVVKAPIPYYNRSLFIYSNFGTSTNENRTAVLQYFRDNFKNDTVIVEDKRIDWKTYLLKLGNSQFVVSPPGAGPDCYRTWEALAMGAVPIVLKSELQTLYENMPVMIVNDWTEVTNDNLKKFQTEKLNNFSKDGFPWRPKLWLRYWITRIMNVKKDFYQKYCKM